MFSLVNSKQLEIMEEFCRNPELEASIREISRLTNISPKWVSKNVDELEELELLSVEESKVSKKVSTGKEFTEFKEIYNFAELKESRIVEHLDEAFRPDAIVLYGSFERGEDKKDSDIDLAIINGRQIESDLAEFEEKLGREIHLQHIKKLKDTDRNFLNSLANGKVLTGFIETV